MLQVLASKVVKKNESQMEKERELKEEAKKMISEAKFLFGVDESKIKAQFKQK
jgi:hypothetical protein